MKGVRPKEVRWLPETPQHSERTESCTHYFYSAVGNMSIEREDSPCPITCLWWHPLAGKKLMNLSFKLNNNLYISENLSWI